jgi:hypothetical protein
MELLVNRIAGSKGIATMDITSETTSQTAPMKSSEVFSVPVDPEHSGLRMMVVVVFLVSGVILYLITTRLIPQLSGINIIAAVVALAGATILTQVIDRLFKQRWPSGRALRIVGTKIQLALRDNVQREIDGEQHVNVLMWRFTISKRTRIPKGWYMIATALHQDDLYLPVYTFVSPSEFDALPYSKQYTGLQPKKVNEQQDLKVAGQQRRLRTAEDARWTEGAEMSKADYERYLARLSQQFPEWMPVDR